MLGDRLRYIREIRNYTQEYVAQRAGINVVLYRQYELGKKKPKEAQLQKIADALLVHIDFLRLPKVGSSDSLLALLYELINQYGDCKLTDDGDSFNIKIPHTLCNNETKDHLRKAVEAQAKCSEDIFKKWLLNYHYGRVRSLDCSTDPYSVISRYPELDLPIPFV